MDRISKGVFSPAPEAKSKTNSPTRSASLEQLVQLDRWFNSRLDIPGVESKLKNVRDQLAELEAKRAALEKRHEAYVAPRRKNRKTIEMFDYVSGERKQIQQPLSIDELYIIGQMMDQGFRLRRDHDRISGEIKELEDRLERLKNISKPPLSPALREIFRLYASELQQVAPPAPEPEPAPEPDKVTNWKLNFVGGA